MADYVIALTKAEAYYYKRNGLKKIQVIPEAVSTLKPCHPSELHKFRSKYGINENDKVLLMVSRIVWYKGINFAIKTLPFLLEKFCNIKLLVVGPDGGNKDRCIEFAKKLGCETNVIFTGEISDKELDCAFEMADVVLVLSIFEAYGRVVLEAWAHKKPVIVTKSVGSAELLSKERGFVIDYGDYLALAKSIIELLTNTALASRMAANGYNFVESEFKWKRSVEKMLNLYNKLLP
jgi:glycosyltransferase involved in cell wall biosynthesis